MTITPLVPDGQWSAAELQVINWGGFHGHHRLPLALAATLVTGTSGSGKSTLLDAVIAVLMTHTVAFNGASNDTAGGPARSGQQRSVITYVRGKRDTAADDGDGRLTDKVLRGDGEPAWGAVALTFVNGDRRRFTVLRTYYVAAGATRMDGVTERRFTVPGDFDLADIEPLRDNRFAPEPMKRRFADMKHYGSYPEFRQAFCTKLGIGNADQGENALKLLSRIQAARPLTTVDQTYKDLVLDDPDTLARADDCLAHFAALDQAYRDLETAGHKEQVLHGVHDEHARWKAATDKAGRIDRFEVGRQTSITPFRLWSLRHRRRLLDAGEVQVKQQLKDARADRAEAKAATAALRSELAEVERQRRENGGDALASLETRIEVARADLAKAEGKLEALLDGTQVLNVGFRSRAEFDQAVEAARTFAAGFDQQRQQYSDERDKLMSGLPAIRQRIVDVTDELRSLLDRDDRVPPVFDKARRMIADASGLRLSDLPFAAQLVDIHPDYEPWRDAAEVTLRSVGLTLLMDARRQEHVRTSIDRLHLPVRVSMDGVDLGAAASRQPDPRCISGRLVFKDDSPFVGWVRDRVTMPGTDHLCVDDPAELGGAAAKVTINGQTSRGRRGAHGRNADARPILGFSNEALKEQLRDELRHLQVQEARIRDGAKRLDTAAKHLADLFHAHTLVGAAEWASIDVAGLKRTVDDAVGQHRALLAKSDILAALNERYTKLDVTLGAAVLAEHKAVTAETDLDDRWQQIVARQDATTNELIPIEDGDTVKVSDEDDEFLQAKLADQDPDVTWEGFDKAADRLAGRLAEESRRERDAATISKANLEGTFRIFHDRWPDPNRGTTIEWFPEYAAIYDEIVRDGLHDRRAKFQRQMQEWSGQDLRLLNNAYGQARKDIKDRLDAVNPFLAAVPFGPQRERLQMTFKDVPNPQVDEFRSGLRILSSDTTKPLDEDEAKARFLQLREFMAKLGWSEAGNGKRADDLLDVRRHVRIGASRFDADNREVGVYESLAGKSGGESQELAAFIIGAALRYQLGDVDQPLPRFAPVFLDEGFVKADWEYAGRAVQAWRSLGFQLIVSAPLDKVTALEPHMDAAAVITKDLDTGYSFVTTFPDMRSWAEAQRLKDAS